jgi:phospholipase C
MKVATRSLLLPIVLAATLASAQTVNHVIVVMMENRTPDNLFGSDVFATTRQLPSAHLSSTGLCGTDQFSLQNFSSHLDICWDPDHSHKAWTTTWGSHDRSNGWCLCHLGRVQQHAVVL